MTGGRLLKSTATTEVPKASAVTGIATEALLAASVNTTETALLPAPAANKTSTETNTSA